MLRPRIQTENDWQTRKYKFITFTNPKVVWQHFQKTHLFNIHKLLTTETQKNTQKPEVKQRNDESQTSPKKEVLPHVSGSSTEPFLGKQQRARQYRASMTPRNVNLKTNDMKTK